METQGEHQPAPMTAASVEEAVALVKSDRARYPLIIAPWGEMSGANQYVVNNETELRDAVDRALKDSTHEARVHVIQGYGNRESRTVTHTDN